MKRARVAFGGAIHTASEEPAGVRLADNRVLSNEAVVWLPPVEPRTVFAVGLNYRDHAREISVAEVTEPLVFLKGASGIVGHRAFTRKPADAAYMHYECELAVVIGRTARNVPRSSAYEYVAGYTVANDYVIRDYLENYYRPNLRAKNRDGCTLLGPWLVDAGDIPDPMNCTLRTSVNGKVTQEGCTRDMVFNIAFLIEYLSSFMTLSPRDVILTGTPVGVVNVHPGDEVVTEIDGIGRLTSFIVDDAAFGIGGP